MKRSRHLTYYKGLVPFTLGFTPICVPCGDSSRPPPMSHSGVPPENWRPVKREILTRANLAAIPLEEILSHPDLDVQGLLLSSFVLDVEWLGEYLNLRGENMSAFSKNMSAFSFVAELKHLTILHGDVVECAGAEVIRPPTPRWGTHHSKFLLVDFGTVLRFVVTSANFIENDWAVKNQHVAVIDLPMTATAPEGEGLALLSYLARAFGKDRGAHWKHRVGGADWSRMPCNVHLIYSCPGEFGTRLVESKLADLKPINRVLIAQTSSVATLTEKFWSRFLGCFRSSTVKVIFPSVRDVRQSWAGWDAGRSLFLTPSSLVNKDVRYWGPDISFLKRLVAQAVPDINADVNAYNLRALGMPHCKTYLGLSAIPEPIRNLEDLFTPVSVEFIYIGSHNLSQSSWAGANGPKSFEMGLLIKGDLFTSPLGGLGVACGKRYSGHVPFALSLRHLVRAEQRLLWNHKTAPRGQADRYGRCVHT